MAGSSYHSDVRSVFGPWCRGDKHGSYSAGALIPSVILPPGHARRLHAIALVCDQISQCVPFRGPSRRSGQTHSPSNLCLCVRMCVYARFSCVRDIPKTAVTESPSFFCTVWAEQWVETRARCTQHTEVCSDFCSWAPQGRNEPIFLSYPKVKWL